MLSVVTDDAAHSELAMSLDELAREGARRMLAAALEAEVDAYIAAHTALTGCLVIVGVRADGRKELVAVADGTRESTDDWAELLRALRRRGMLAPVVMVGDRALGLWRALQEVFPAAREQRCWVHVVRNVLGALPNSIHAGARRGLNEIILAEDRTHTERAIDAFAGDYGVKWPKAVAKVTSEAERLLCFFDYPVEHWIHLRTTKGRWRAVNGPHLVALVRAGVRFQAGKLVERAERDPHHQEAAS